MPKSARLTLSVQNLPWQDETNHPLFPPRSPLPKLVLPRVLLTASLNYSRVAARIPLPSARLLAELTLLAALPRPLRLPPSPQKISTSHQAVFSFPDSSSSSRHRSLQAVNSRRLPPLVRKKRLMATLCANHPSASNLLTGSRRTTARRASKKSPWATPSSTLAAKKPQSAMLGAPKSPQTPKSPAKASNLTDRAT